MTELALLFVVLMMVGCVVVMGAMAVMAWRGMRHREPPSAEPDVRRRSGPVG